MKILVIRSIGHVDRLVVDELCARAGDVRVLARQRPRPGALSGVTDLLGPLHEEIALRAYQSWEERDTPTGL